MMLGGECDILARHENKIDSHSFGTLDPFAVLGTLGVLGSLGVLGRSSGCGTGSRTLAYAQGVCVPDAR